MKKLIQIFLSVAFIGLICGNASGQSFEAAIDAYMKKDYKTAFKIAKPLAEQGDPTGAATAILSAMYWTGQGVRKNLILGYFWASCHAQKFPEGANAKRLKFKKKRMSKAQITRAEKKAKKCP
jgi:TPR repeat protein